MREARKDKMGRREKEEVGDAGRRRKVIVVIIVVVDVINVQKWGPLFPVDRSPVFPERHLSLKCNKNIVDAKF